MPELPEVENVKNTLSRLIIGKTIKQVEIRWENIIKLPEPEEFITRLKGQTVERIERRGKFLKIICSEDTIVSHLRMEGRYGLFQKEEPADKHTHVFFEFEDGTELRYRDVRKFGTMHLFPKGTEDQFLPLSKLGAEPLSEEFTPKLMKQSFQKTNRSIKAVLLDQQYITGLGNIYVDEALHRAGIHPETPASKLSLHRLKKLHHYIVAILSEAVEKGGSTIRSYVNSVGEQGSFQLTLYVYGRAGQSCRSCGREIVRTVVAGRGTHICQACQK
ncbi:DNA-formamidopyrimidine glycosylase [Fictibacillus aquaticus]|uniref:Formamidopyrimidine-DNA glycosylase n=1 Tax=Fictibacillus aquaticus TaxID=2021314 RepID=A0A235FA11_9BACL|nr:DNA-formamidopyrimidine glycosylase [Fictibacillus aquaticus]OYD58170.1 DNA-formamidopyrimidine glycosylase [Fictibacillus aquaticus]